MQKRLDSGSVLSFSGSICASTTSQEENTGMGTFWDAPCKNPTCSHAPKATSLPLGSRDSLHHQPFPCWPFAPAQLFPLPGSDILQCQGCRAPQTSALHTLNSLTSCRAHVTDISPATLGLGSQPHGSLSTTPPARRNRRASAGFPHAGASP